MRHRWAHQRSPAWAEPFFQTDSDAISEEGRESAELQGPNPTAGFGTDSDIDGSASDFRQHLHRGASGILQDLKFVE